MAEKNKETDKEVHVEQIISRSEQFIEKNKKAIIYGIIGFAVVVSGTIGFFKGYLAPMDLEAKKAIFRAEQYFERDSFALALNGNGVDFEGFESISKQYGMTQTGNLAKAYAGICYYKLGDPQQAIKWLKGYKADDQQVGPAIIGLIGDCYVSTGNTKEGISYFKKAASKADNEIISPIYLKKAGIAYESLSQYNDAIKVYTEIKEKYNRSVEATEIDKYIARAEIQSKSNN